MNGFLKALQLRKNKQDLLAVKQSNYKLMSDAVIETIISLKNTSRYNILPQHSLKSKNSFTMSYKKKRSFLMIALINE